MGSQFAVENAVALIESLPPVESPFQLKPQASRPLVHRMPPPVVIHMPDATVMGKDDAHVEIGGDEVPESHCGGQSLCSEVLDANLVAYEDFAGLCFSDSLVAASDKSDPCWRASAAPADAINHRVKLMCSFGGEILPRPCDGQLRYVGGETRILSVSRHVTYADLVLKLTEIYGQSLSLKYQLPDEDIDSLVLVCSDEDLENMMEEFDRLDAGEGSSKLRVFLFSSADYDVLHLSDSGDRRNSEQKYVDAVNSVRDISLRNLAEMSNSFHDLIGLDDSNVETSGLLEQETFLTSVTSKEADLHLMPIRTSVPSNLYSGKVPVTTSAIPSVSLSVSQPSQVNYQYITLKAELSNQDSEFPNSAGSSASSHSDLPYQLSGLLESNSHGRMCHIDSHGRIGHTGRGMSLLEDQKEPITHLGATDILLDDSIPCMLIPEMDFYQSHFQAQQHHIDFVQTSWQCQADEYLLRPTSSVGVIMQKQVLEQEQQAFNAYTPAAHETVMYRQMDQQQQQEKFSVGILPAELESSSPIFQIGSTPSILNIENRQKEMLTVAHPDYEQIHFLNLHSDVFSKPIASPFAAVNPYYDAFGHYQEKITENKTLIEEQQSHLFPNLDSNQDFTMHVQPDGQPLAFYFNDRQGNFDWAFQHKASNSHGTKLPKGIQTHMGQINSKEEKKSVVDLPFNNHVEIPAANFPLQALPEESLSLPKLSVTSVGYDSIESTPFDFRAAFFPVGATGQLPASSVIVASEGLQAAQLSTWPEINSLLPLQTKLNTVTVALGIPKDLATPILASHDNDYTYVPMGERSFLVSNDSTKVSMGQRSSAEKTPNFISNQLPLQITSLVPGNGSNTSESSIEELCFNAVESEVRQQNLQKGSCVNEESLQFKTDLPGNVNTIMNPGEELPLVHLTNTKSLIGDATGVPPCSDHHSSGAPVETNSSYVDLLATLATKFDSSLVNAVTMASPVAPSLPEAVTSCSSLSSLSVDFLPVSIHLQVSNNCKVEGAQAKGQPDASLVLKSEISGLNITSLAVPEKLEDMDPLSASATSEEQHDFRKNQSNSFSQSHIYNSEDEHKKSSLEHVREGANAALSQLALCTAPTLSIHNWEESLTQEQVSAAVLSEEKISESVKTNAAREKEVLFEEIKTVIEEEDIHEFKIHQSNNTAAIAEAEAIARGLQIIKNADLEELRELGAGTFGTVYHGKWRGTDVAIKRIKSSCFTGRPSERERLIADFWSEACILSQLHHPNVVAFYGVVPDGPGGTLATVTEFMVNGSLKQVLERKDRTIDRRKRLLIAMDAAFGMEYLHGKNIVHFDLKCENLLVNMRDPQRPICKVGDLGLSKIKHQTLLSGGVRGTLPWMAPELLNGSSSLVSEKVDVFSFGIVMWELLTGEEPYANMHYGAIIGGIVNNTLRPSVPNWCSAAWKSLMERCWSAEPNERPSFPDIAKELRAMAASLHAKGQAQTQTAGQAQGKAGLGATPGV